MKSILTIQWDKIIVGKKTYRELPTSDGDIDLCAFPTFTGFNYNNSENYIVLNFIEDKEKNFELNDGGKTTRVISAHLIFDKIVFLKMSDRDSLMPQHEDLSLEYFVLTDRSDGDYHFLFSYHGGREIYISAKTVRIAVGL
jgi:hypothetical protein